ncbi:MAG: insulinase family protein [Acidobacteria bacterium]|nr:insulinase family protein [Acidobacteriota bacterium]
MNTKSYFKNLTTAILFLFLSLSFADAQTEKLPTPRQEKLLNGMNLLVWNAPDNAGKVTVKLRIHSGSAFDTQGKEGTMALLADALFQTQAQREFFVEDLGGSLDVASNYDYIQITATATNDQFLTMLEIIASAVTNPQIDKETTLKLRDARLEKVKELEKNPSYIADQAVAKRLFGDFPYGRAQGGTTQSLATIDFADLIFAKQRFLTADNATLAVVGSVRPDLAYRAAKRFFGGWTKADKKIPATFRQPETPDAKELIIESPNTENGMRRSALMVGARNDKDFYATKVLTEIWQTQFCYGDDSKYGRSSLEPHLLRGTYVVSINLSVNELPASARNLCGFVLLKDGKKIYPPIMQTDFEQAKSKIVADLNKKTMSVIDLADLWLDVDTFKLVSVNNEMSKLNNVTLADVQRVAADLQKQPVVNVVVKKPDTAKNK